jgi:hypothetical protein
MNKERYNQIIDEAYGNYIYNPDYKAETVADLMGSQAGQLFKCPTQEDFINQCKTDSEFSEKWGLKIEERNLSLEERHQLALPIWKEKYGPLADMMVPTNVDNTPFKIPTKLITLTYKDTIIESYE